MSDSSVTMQDLIERNRLRHERDHAEDAAKIRQVWEAVEGLIREGFPVEHSPWNATNLTVEVAMADLPRVYRAVGSVRVWYKDVAYSGGEALNDTVQVTVTSVKYPSVRFRYVKPLAESASPRKCRIVTTSRVETSTSLVCDVA